jgi:hypothetical protein
LALAASRQPGKRRRRLAVATLAEQHGAGEDPVVVLLVVPSEHDTSSDAGYGSPR